MKGVLQRVNSACLLIDQKKICEIKKGILLFIGIEKNDVLEDINYIIKKVLGIRIFNDSVGKINFSIKDIDGEILVVSQFTLCANIQKGLRPSFTGAANPNTAKEIYNLFCNNIKQHDISIKTGVFGANMQIDLINDGPFTINLDSQNRK